MIDEPDQPKMEIARIPYVDGLSQEIRQIARTAGVRCSFFMPNKLRSLYQAKDSLPQETTTNAVYSVTCTTCDAEYIGESKRAIRIREEEHQRWRPSRTMRKIGSGRAFSRLRGTV